MKDSTRKRKYKEYILRILKPDYVFLSQLQTKAGIKTFKELLILLIWEGVPVYCRKNGIIAPKRPFLDNFAAIEEYKKNLAIANNEEKEPEFKLIDE